MKCPVHSDKDVVGYCVDCGAFGCELCLVPRGKGESLCASCAKTRDSSRRTGEKKGLFSKILGDSKPAAPAAERPSGARASVVRKGTAGRKLVVRFRDNKVVKGTTYKLDTQSVGFHLVPVEPVGGQDRIYIYFSDLKAIYFVRDFEGKFDPATAAPQRAGEGTEVKVAFQDGEVIEGTTIHHFDPACQRFFILPKDNNGNNISILVERSALKGMEMEGFRQGVFADEEVSLGLPDTLKKGRAPLSQNESMGDLYFSMKNYDSALLEYEKVKQEYPNDKRLALKISVCNFNRGVSFIKSRKYLEAKAEFEKISEDDPIYEKARKKARKIDKILKEAKNMGA